MSRHELFVEEGLVAPPLSPAMGELRATLLACRPHAFAQRVGWTGEQQWWLLHRMLFNQPETILELLREFILDTADPDQVIPLPCELYPLVRACWRTWVELAALKIAVDYEVEPERPLPPNCRRRDNRDA